MKKFSKMAIKRAWTNFYLCKKINKVTTLKFHFLFSHWAFVVLCSVPNSSIHSSRGIKWSSFSKYNLSFFWGFQNNSMLWIITFFSRESFLFFCCWKQAKKSTEINWSCCKWEQSRWKRTLKYFVIVCFNVHVVRNSLPLFVKLSFNSWISCFS